MFEEAISSKWLAPGAEGLDQVTLAEHHFPTATSEATELVAILALAKLRWRSFFAV